MTREHIVLAALRLFLHRGYNAVSLIDVAREAGITKGGVYHYFASKDDLLHVSLHYFLDRFESNYRELLSNSCSIQALIKLLLVDRAMENYASELLQIKPDCSLDYAHFALEVMRKFPDIQQRIEASYVRISQILAERLQAACAAGELCGQADCQALAITLLSITNGQKSMGRIFQTQAVRRQVAEEICRLISK